ncbi:MAG: EAL domain-containing protein [Novosphingobium sp.]|nr:EAL domain-containing protein [Novosphingobium sp.]
MFVGTGGTVLPSVVRSLAGVGGGPERLLTNALLLNIALIVFGWRRYRELSDEVRERRKAEAHARRLAETDPLTGCLNRRSIGPNTDALIAAAAERGQVVAFVMIDVDNFKQINDCNGHSIGDAILLECARRIGALLPRSSLMARLGGDEFACVVPFEPHHGETIDQLATSIIESVARPVSTGAAAPQIETTVSLGLSRSDGGRSSTLRQTTDAQALLHSADVAMYQAKKDGRNRYCWFEPTMESELRFRNELETGIRQGISRGEFVPYYEQQIDLASGDLVGFEMLARWHSPNFGVVGPDVFIPVAEEIGLIDELSESVIRQALDDAKQWNPRLTLSVNISPLQLRDPWFAQKLLKLLLEANFPPNRLDIEITESCLHENIGIVRSLFTSLKNQGIGVSLDDFGTGYSSLAQLRNLPFDRLKIDRSFVTRLTDDKDSETIVQAITSLGEGLGLPITAEGIESGEILDRLRLLGKFKGQGYFYGRPADAEQTRRLLAGQGLLVGEQAAPPAADTTADHDDALRRRA